MPKAREILARSARRGFYGPLWFYCALFLVAVTMLFADAAAVHAKAEGEGSADESVPDAPATSAEPAPAASEAPPAETADAASAEAAPSPAELAREAAKARGDAASEIRRIHVSLVRARTAAVEEDPDIGRMEQRAKALEAEARRVRAEMEERISKVPNVAALQAELDAAEAKFRSLGDARPSRGADGSRRIRRKPDTDPAQE